MTVVLVSQSLSVTFPPGLASPLRSLHSIALLSAFAPDKENVIVIIVLYKCRHHLHRDGDSIYTIGLLKKI